MSALDQAFIKAYAKNPAVSTATSTQPLPAHYEAESSATDAYAPGPMLSAPYRLDPPQSALQPHARFARTGNTLRSRYTAPPPEEFLPPPPTPVVQEYPELLPSAWKKKSLGLSQLARQLAGLLPAATADADPLLLVQEAVELSRIPMLGERVRVQTLHKVA